jgi:arabinofuranosyltransferase
MLSPPQKQGKPAAAALIPAAVLTLAAAAAWMAWLAVYQVDDAYIVYRYAANLAHGYGFVFNPGERVEGVTCFLWTVILAPLAALGVPLPRVAPWLTAIAGLSVVGLLPGTAARLRRAGARGAAMDDPNAAVTDAGDWLASALLAAHPAFAYWSVGALETVPYALLLLLALRDQIDEQARGSGRRSAFWLGLASLVRPETPVVAAALGLGRLIDGPGRAPRARAAGVARWVAIIAAFFVPFLIFRRLYFGDWLPNTYYAKTGLGPMGNLDLGRQYTLPFLASLAPSFGSIALPAATAGLAMLFALLAWALPRPGLRSAALLICGIGAGVLLDGGDWMFLHRFWVPALPPLILLLAAAARALAAAGASGTTPAAGAARPRRATIAITAAAVVLGASYVTYGVSERNGPEGLLVNAAGYRFAHHEVADFLKERAHPGDVVALMDVGIIGYESGLGVIDISGLTDPRVARAPGGFLDKQYPVASLLAAAPRFFVLVNGFSMDEAILADPEFQRTYRLVFERNHRFNWTPPGAYVLHVYERAAAG